MQIGFAQHHRTGLLQASDGAGAELGHVASQSAAACGGRHTSHVDVVFDHQGPAAQRLSHVRWVDRNRRHIVCNIARHVDVGIEVACGLGDALRKTGCAHRKALIALICTLPML